MVKGGKVLFLGKTYKEIFEGRLRIGTFSSSEMPNHVFLAVLTADQIRGGVGKKWLKILKENGFEFIRATDNSVYTGSSVIEAPGKNCTSSHPNYIFGLFRNIGKGAMADPYTPPKEWTDLPSVVPEFHNCVSGGFYPEKFNEEVQAAQLKLWNAGQKPTLYTEEELVAEGVPITLAGRRSLKPQELKAYRKNDVSQTPVSASSPFGKAPAPAPVEDTHDIEYDEEDFDEDYYEE